MLRAYQNNLKLLYNWTCNAMYAWFKCCSNSCYSCASFKRITSETSRWKKNHSIIFFFFLNNHMAIRQNNKGNRIVDKPCLHIMGNVVDYPYWHLWAISFFVDFFFFLFVTSFRKHFEAHIATDGFTWYFYIVFLHFLFTLTV